MTFQLTRLYSKLLQDGYGIDYIIKDAVQKTVAACAAEISEYQLMRIPASEYADRLKKAFANEDSPTI